LLDLVVSEADRARVLKGEDAMVRGSESR